VLYKTIFAPEVYDDIQKAVDFYTSRKKGLGKQFFKTVKSQLSHIKSNAFGFQVRYDAVRCVPIKSFPYTIHYRVVQETKTITIVAVFCDYIDPEIWDDRILK